MKMKPVTTLDEIEEAARAVRPAGLSCRGRRPMDAEQFLFFIERQKRVPELWKKYGIEPLDNFRMESGRRIS